MLRQTEGYLSGQQLCEKFQVSRTAVWKAVEQLKEEGYQIEAVRNRGYRLQEVPDVIHEAELASLIDTKWAGKSIYYMEETDSTNIQAKKLGEAGAEHGTLVVTDRQTSGRGRRGRRWESPAGSNIFMSLLLRPELEPNLAPMLTLVMAQSIAQATREDPGVPAQIKWPNDLVIEGKKTCGILTEMSTEIDWINYVVIGIGINVNVSHFPQELEGQATSLFLETGKKICRSKLIASVLMRFEENYRTFMEQKNMSALQEDYDQLLVNRNREVRVLDPGREYSGYALGIDELGQLLVRKADGEVVKVFAGEISVRGVYGYV